MRKRILADKEAVARADQQRWTRRTAGITSSGFELAFGTNYVGPFLLTGLLLERLREIAPARIVNVSSIRHYRATGIDYESVRRPTKSLTGLPEYYVSKLGNVLHAQELARRLERT